MSFSLIYSTGRSPTRDILEDHDTLSCKVEHMIEFSGGSYMNPGSPTLKRGPDCSLSRSFEAIERGKGK